jgi:hypothetical protein
VTSATLEDTDRALHGFLHSQWPIVHTNIKVFRLYAEENPNTVILLERTERTKPAVDPTLTLNHEPLNLFSKQALFDNLDIEGNHKILDDDCNWLAAPKSSLYTKD